MKHEDLTGKKFGMLTPIRYLGGSKWECKCDCGNTTITLAGRLKRGNTTSCGCKKSIDYNSFIGKKVGMVTVEKLENGKFICICDCGQRCIKTKQQIANNQSAHNSCGCMQKEAVKKTLKETNEKYVVEHTNIRLIEKSLNGELQPNNTSGHTGVSYDKSIKVWKAFIKFKGKTYYLGSSKNYDYCVALREEAEKRIFGDFLEWYNNNIKKSEVK